MNLPTLIKEVIRDGLRYGFASLEKIRNLKGDLIGFRTVDSGHIYLAPNPGDSNRQNRQEAYTKLMSGKDLKEVKNANALAEVASGNKAYKWLQVINDIPKTAFTEKQLLVHNFFPVPDLDTNGYPRPPIESIVKAVSSHINIASQNHLFFANGRASKGLLVIKSEALTEPVMQRLRQQFYASINGTANCLSGESKITTPNGITTIENYLKKSITAPIKVWTGTDFKEGLVFKTKQKQKNTIYLNNNTKIVSSPEHRFMVIDDTGEPAWKCQKDLSINDYILSNKINIEKTEWEAPRFKDNEVTSELMEVLGWMTGDGSLKSKGKIKNVSLFYHHNKELDILDNHLNILKKYNLNPIKKHIKLTDSQVESVKSKYGFKSASSDRFRIELYSAEFVDFLTKTINFDPNRLGHNVPFWLHSAPESFKISFLRGLFSADGSNANQRNPTLHVMCPIFREEIKDLLLSMGIRTLQSEGKTHVTFVKNKRGVARKASYLKIKDKDLFFKKIGFLQKHKQPAKVKEENDLGKHSIPRSMINKYTSIVHEKMRKEGRLGTKEAALLRAVKKGENCSLQRLFRILDNNGIKRPEWTDSYNLLQVSDLVASDEMIEMYDLEVFDERHQFIVNGVVCHNSHRSPFFQIGVKDSIDWVPMEGGKDGEFQYLDEKTTRVILAAFGMAPEEIPALSNIGHPTPTQALSESNQEYKMSVGRFASQYNLLYTLQVMLNELMEEIDPEVAKYCVFKFVGLQVDDQQRELIRAQQAANLYLNGNELRRMFEADQLPIGGNLPLNPAIMNVISNNFYMNQWLYQFTGDKSVLTDMTLGFISNGNWFNYIQGVGREIFLSKERIGKAMGDYLKEIKEIMEEDKIKDDETF